MFGARLMEPRVESLKLPSISSRFDMTEIRAAWIFLKVWRRTGCTLHTLSILHGMRLSVAKCCRPFLSELLTETLNMG